MAMITDKFVKNVLSFVLLLIFLLILVPTILTAFVVYGTGFFNDPEPDYVLTIIDIFPKFQEFPADLLSLLVQALPALIGAFCYRTSKQETLNWFGRLAFLVLLLGVLLSAVLVGFIDAEDQNQQAGITGGQLSLQYLESSCETTLRACLTYLFLIIGLQIPFGKGSKQSG